MGGLGMHEEAHALGRADAFVVDELHIPGGQLFQAALHVGHFQADVVQPLASFGKIFGHARGLGGGRDQFDGAFACWQEGDFHLLRGHEQTLAYGQAQLVLVGVDGFIQIIDNDGDVIDASNVHKIQNVK